MLDNLILQAFPHFSKENRYDFFLYNTFFLYFIHKKRRFSPPFPFYFNPTLPLLKVFHIIQTYLSLDSNIPLRFFHPFRVEILLT